MADRQADRAAWAALVADLIAAESAGNKTKFAEMVGVDRKTINRWVAQEVAVSEENVRAVARATGLRAADLLVRVGYYEAKEIGEAPSVEPAEADERAIELIKGSNATPALKRRLITHVQEMRVEHEQMRAAEVARMLDVAGAKPAPES